MGKPFAKELDKISETYSWALNTELNVSNEYLNKIQSNHSYIVGSGGSLSACYFLSMILQKAGYFSKAITPLDLFYAKESIPSSNIIFISASGRNSDILFAHKLCVSFEARNIFSICMKENSLLSKESQRYTIANILDLNLPSGKDGFLATNSLIAYFTIIKRLFDKKPILETLKVTNSQIRSIEIFSQLLNNYFSISILYSGWGLPVAIDLESKLTEAGLGNSHIADFRNFAHGRHNWFDKKKNEASIIALITPENEELAEKTLSLLPKNIPVLRLKSPFLESDASLDLLLQSFHFIKQIGKLVSIDPGRPGVPEYGSKLYHLKYGQLFINQSFQKNELKTDLPIIRKVGYIDYMKMSVKEKEFWRNSLVHFTDKLQKTRFGGIIFDYDGTICDAEDRFNLPSENMKKMLIHFLKNNAILGIATGRGKSVRNDLQSFIPEPLRKRVVVGYYNCSQIGLLTNDKLPQKSSKTDLLTEVIDVLRSNLYIYDNIDFEQKPKQIEIKVKDSLRSAAIKRSIFDILVAKFFGQIKILESSHSIDIITADVSKRLILDACKSIAIVNKLPTDFICVGDKGKWPGNDYGLLSEEYSLSVDEVSANTTTCWNLASLGIRNSDATLEYLNAFSISKKGTIRVNLKK